MRIVTWNMGCGWDQSPYRGYADEAWFYLLNELRPDVAFVQEAVLSRVRSADDFNAVLCELPASMTAGTAVLVRKPRPVILGRMAKIAGAYLASAAIRTELGTIGIVSVHVDPGDGHKPALKALPAALRDLDAFLIAGGDFNAARRFQEVYGHKHHGEFFSAMQAANFHEPHWAIQKREVQSFWGPRTKEAYQDDHFFVSQALAPRVGDCFVCDNEVVRRVSDHGPVVLDIDLAITDRPPHVQ